MMVKRFSLGICCIAAAVLRTTASDDPSMVLSLPGLVGSTVAPNSLFAGYLNVSGRHYYYIFARAQTSPDDAPFLFWTNGGPGCSSVGEGLWMEHGPYQMSSKHAGPEPNPYSWNKLANVLYLEHPVGVGFSYSDNKDDYLGLNDFKEADELYAALLQFFDRYPKFAPNPTQGLYLSGESYGGEYVPHLAHRIVFGESELLKTSLKGIAIANPALNCAADKSGYSATLQYQLFFHHGLMSFSQFRKWSASSCDQGSQALSDKCQKLMDEARSAVGTINQQLKRKQRQFLKETFTAHDQPSGIEASFDPDHKYQSFCLANSTLQFATQHNADTEASQCHPIGDPGRMSEYLNRKDVQAALHVRSNKMPAPNGQWNACASHIQDGPGGWINYTSSQVNVLTNYIQPILEAKHHSDFRMLVFSGDEDIATCPAPITMACLSELEPKVKRTGNWTPWTHNGITAGYFETFDYYTYATVKGAGHTVPQYQPLTTFQLVSRWLKNASLAEPPRTADLVQIALV